jgi:hypothetical protein
LGLWLIFLKILPTPLLPESSFSAQNAPKYVAAGIRLGRWWSLSASPLPIAAKERNTYPDSLATLGALEAEEKKLPVKMWTGWTWKGDGKLYSNFKPIVSETSLSA